MNVGAPSLASEDFLAVYDANPVDTSNPAAICDRLADIEDRMAFVTNELSRAAYWRKKGTIDLGKLRSNLYGTTEGTIPERQAQLEVLVMQDPMSDKLERAEAAYALYKDEFEGLDSRKSILQSILKYHVREQEPQYGQGSHHR